MLNYIQGNWNMMCIMYIPLLEQLYQRRTPQDQESLPHFHNYNLCFPVKSNLIGKHLLCEYKWVFLDGRLYSKYTWLWLLVFLFWFWDALSSILLCKINKYLWVSFHLSTEHCVVEELLKPLILVVMAQVIKQCTIGLADWCRVLETWRVQHVHWCHSSNVTLKRSDRERWLKSRSSLFVVLIPHWMKHSGQTSAHVRTLYWVRDVLSGFHNQVVSHELQKTTQLSKRVTFFLTER